MAQPKWSVTAVQPLKDYKLLIDFADGSKKVFDMHELMEWPMFRKLRNPGVFMQAHTECGTVVWDDDTDIAPEHLYE